MTLSEIQSSTFIQGFLLILRRCGLGFFDEYFWPSNQILFVSWKQNGAWQITCKRRKIWLPFGRKSQGWKWVCFNFSPFASLKAIYLMMKPILNLHTLMDAGFCGHFNWRAKAPFLFQFSFGNEPPAKPTRVLFRCDNGYTVTIFYSVWLSSYIVWISCF